jgi:putative ABC transport system permease protein
VAPWEDLARPWLQRIYGREGQLGSRNTQRAKWRTALTVGALMVGVAMILSISSLTTSFEHDIRAWVDTYMGGDLYVHSTLPLRSDLELRLKAIPGVAAVTPVRFIDIKWTRADGTNENVAFMAVDPESYRRVTSFSFAANQGDPNALLDRLAAGNTVFVSSVMAERNGFKQGDNLYLETKHGKQVFEIAAIVVDFYNLGLVIEGSWRDMHRYFGIDNVSGYFLKTQPGISSDEVQKRIGTLYGKSRHLTIESNKSLKSRVLNLMAQSSSLFDVLALIAMLVSALGVVNTMTMNVMERIKEIGMLRSLGMTRWQVSKMILAEAGLMGLAGGVYGLLFGLFLSRVLLMALNAIHGYDLTYVVPMQGIIISLLIALLVSQLAAIWPARRASGVRLVETIHFE